MTTKSSAPYILLKHNLLGAKIKDNHCMDFPLEIKKMGVSMNQLPRSQIFLVFLLCFASLQLLSSANNYFINCGSDSNVHLSDNRDFVGDLNLSSLHFTKESTVVKNTSSSTAAVPLYQTARVFRKKNSLYKFNITDKGIYILRLHFFAFSSTDNLPAARFNVFATSPEPYSGFSLLRDFSMENIRNSAPQIMEFILYIDVDEFAIYFTPKASSFAFVNAIEVFLARGNTFTDAFSKISSSIKPQGHDRSFKRLLLQTIYRINVGGPEVKPDGDPLWRKWLPDDSFLVDASNAENKSGNITLADKDKFYAPEAVYQDAKVIKSSSTESDSSNISWRFSVSKTANHFLRAHFCDILSTSKDSVIFDFFINGNNMSRVDLSEAKGPVTYGDYLIDEPDEYGILNISIGLNKDSEVQNAYLNRLEIMEIREADINGGKKKNLVIIVVGSVLGGLVLTSIVILLSFLYLRRKRLKLRENSNRIKLRVSKVGSTYSRSTDPSTHSPARNLNLGLRIPFAEIQLATKNFDQKKMLIGRGGFGNVYKGTLRNGIKVAVKRSEPGSGQGISEFQTEIMVLSKIRHRHLVSLIGYCDDNDEMILVYEYVEKGTLREHLYASNLPRLSWKQRLEICTGAARGLHYLHSGSAGGIIHRDVKSTNILLDENLMAKVADFGLSRSGRLDQNYVSTAIKGTFGYLDPEYFHSQQLTDKSDVYSFGVVLLEVLCARPAIDSSLPREQVNFAEWGVLHMTKGVLEEIVDPTLAGQINPNSLRKFSETTAKCLEESGVDRPSMGDVLWDLEYALQLQQNVVLGGPHEDSTITTGTSDFSTFQVKRFPSFSSSITGNHMTMLSNDYSELRASDVFSELKNEDAR